MNDISRRKFLKVGAAGAMIAASPLLPIAARAAESKAAVPAAATTSAQGVTHDLARYIVGATYADLPAAVRKEGVRTLVNWMAVAVGGSHHETVDRAIAAIAPFSGPKQASALGRKERFDIMNAAFVNGISSHVFDMDDTHLKTIVHPGGPVISAILALSEYQPVSGKDFLNALILGVETSCRVGNAVYPNHYDTGWHISGTAGVFGAAAATGKLLGLNEQQMVWALGLAASQPVGLRESFGSMNKSFNVGRTASNGMMAALLAAKDFTSSDGMIEAKRGWANTISTKQDYREITGELGQRYESLLNTYKPFACGIVIHPPIDAAIQLRNENSLTPEMVESVELRVHPLVLELTGKKTPQTGLEGKFSVFHSVAVAIIDGAAGEHQYSDRMVRDPKTIVLRDKVKATIDSSIKPEQVDMVITLKDGRKLHKFIEHAIGSVEAPMSDKQLEAKFTDLAQGVLPISQTRALIDVCWNVERLPAAASLAKAAVKKA